MIIFENYLFEAVNLEKMVQTHRLNKNPAFCQEVALPWNETYSDYGLSVLSFNLNLFRKAIYQQNVAEACNYIRKFIRLDLPDCYMVSTNPMGDMASIATYKYKSIVNLHKINDLTNINKFLEKVNFSLPQGGHFAGCVETYRDRERRLFGKLPAFISIFPRFFDFVFNRIFPKIKCTSKIHLKITKGKNRAISKAEALGRLVSCGFEIIDYQNINGLKYFICKKVKEPAFDANPSYGPVFKMKRIGMDGKIIQVYKLRTMHPYSEYLQEYLYKSNNLDEGGKFRDDFRISNLGRFMRKFWIDELPMIYNLIRGDIKLVGVRPLSEHYFNLYSRELQEKRVQTKPGLIPPYYADMPKTMKEIMASELKYLEQYKLCPFWTDLSYFFKCIANIVVYRARSK